jgi:hypothetical protein
MDAAIRPLTKKLAAFSGKTSAREQGQCGGIRNEEGKLAAIPLKAGFKLPGGNTHRVDGAGIVFDDEVSDMALRMQNCNGVLCACLCWKIGGSHDEQDQKRGVALWQSIYSIKLFRCLFL